MKSRTKTYTVHCFTVDKRTLQIVLLKMQGYSLKEIAPMVDFIGGCCLCEVRPSAEKAGRNSYSI